MQSVLYERPGFSVITFDTEIRIAHEVQKCRNIIPVTFSECIGIIFFFCVVAVLFVVQYMIQVA